MTPAQSKLLAFIASYQDANNGVSPSYDDMADAIGSVKSNVYRILDCLEAEGRIERRHFPQSGKVCARSITIGGSLSAVSNQELIAEMQRRLSIGRLAV
jgi:DNA-binding MarR family transcriptional regulator